MLPTVNPIHDPASRYYIKMSKKKPITLREAARHYKKLWKNGDDEFNACRAYEAIYSHQALLKIELPDTSLHIGSCLLAFEDRRFLLTCAHVFPGKPGRMSVFDQFSDKWVPVADAISYEDLDISIVVLDEPIPLLHDSKPPKWAKKAETGERVVTVLPLDDENQDHFGNTAKLNNERHVQRIKNLAEAKFANYSELGFVLGAGYATSDRKHLNAFYLRVDPGHSGSGLFNTKGEILGMLSMGGNGHFAMSYKPSLLKTAAYELLEIAKAGPEAGK